jgi:SHS2 domain-containing protein
MTSDSARTSGWERFDSDGRVGVIGRGPTAGEAFAQTALGMFGVITHLGGIDARESREIRAHADSLEGLLVAWLNECLYVHEVEGFVACGVEVRALDARPKVGGEPFRLHGLLHGEEVEPGRHSLGAPVKGALTSGASLREIPGGFEGRALLDVR